MEQILDENQIQESSFIYASVGRRFVAILIDGLLLGSIQALINVSFLGYFWMPDPLNPPSPLLVLPITLINYTIAILYESIMISSNKKATVGKMAMGIVVVDLNGNKISFGKAIGRYFSKIVSAIILGIGYFMAFFDDKKRTLHDKMVGTLVIKQ